MYSVNLTERFCRENFSIINAVEKEESTNNHKFYYILKIGNSYINAQIMKFLMNKHLTKNISQQYNKTIRKTDK